MKIEIDSQDLNTILAALRTYQAAGYGEPCNRPLPIHDIATNMDAEISMNDEGIDDLCERLNVDCNEPEIDRTLVLSTGHLSKATAQRFEDYKPGDRSCIDGHMTDWSIYGWIFYCWDNDETTPPELMQAAEYARSLDCKFIRFDCDGPTVSQLPTFEW